MNNEMNAQQSPTLDESDILPLQQADRTADNPAGILMEFIDDLLTIKIVGGIGGGLTTPLSEAPAINTPDVNFGSPTTPNMMA